MFGEEMTILESTIPVMSLPLPSTCRHTLVNNGITTLGALARLTEDELMAVKGVGPFYYHEIERLVAKLERQYAANEKLEKRVDLNNNTAKDVGSKQ